VGLLRHTFILGAASSRLAPPCGAREKRAGASAQLRKSFFARAVDREGIEQTAHFEQFADMADHITQGETSSTALRLVSRN